LHTYYIDQALFCKAFCDPKHKSATEATGLEKHRKKAGYSG
jgi:hypothetical protein